MSDISALEGHLRDHPDDWESWLVYADWLTEREDPHAELLRLHHRAAHDTIGVKARYKLLQQIDRFAREHRLEGLWPLERRRGEVTWRLGFLWSAELSGPSVARSFERLIAQDHRMLATLTVSELARADIERLGELLPSSKIRVLHVRRVALDGATVRALMRGCGAIVRLDLGGCEIDASGAEAIAASTELSALQALDLSSNLLQDRGVELLLAKDGALRALRALDLSDNDLGLAAARSIAKADHLGHLASLSLGNNEIGAPGAAEIVGTERLPALTDLSVWGNGLGPKGAEALAQAARTRALRRLDLGSNNIGTQHLRHLLAALPALTELSLPGDDLGDEGAEIFASSVSPGLKRLDFGYNELTAKGARLLARTEALDGLEDLSLSNNPIGDDGAEAIIRSPYLRSLAKLDLEMTQISADTLAWLGRAKLLPELRELRVIGNEGLCDAWGEDHEMLAERAKVLYEAWDL